jgi:hypothetical protein
MQASIRKAIWWCLLASGVGGTSIFLYLCTVFGPPNAREWPFYFWPITTVILTVISIGRLRRCYAEDPWVTLGHWHLSISDLLASAIVTGALLGISHGTYPDSFLKLGIPISFISGLHFVAGILVATRSGIEDRWAKQAYALGFVLRNYGCLTAASLFVVMTAFAIIALDLRRSIEICSGVFTFASGSRDDPMLVLIRTGLAILPVGLLLCSWSRRRSTTSS